MNPLLFSGLDEASYEQQVVLILEHSFWLKKQGYRETTIDTAIHSFKAIAKCCELMDPEKVKECIAFRQVSEGQKEKLSSTYDRFCKQHGLEWSIPRYRRVIRLPYVPKQDDIVQLINALSRRQGSFVHLLMETGARPGEAWQLKWIDIDSDNNQITINCPEKNSNPRKLKVSKALIAKLKALTRKCTYVFKVHDSSKFISFARYFYKARLRISRELQNPNIERINLKSLRHFKASQTYYQTKDLLFTQKILGHRSISSTMVYVHLNEFESDGGYIVKVASSLEEFTQLLELNFEFVSDFEGKKILRKRK